MEARYEVTTIDHGEEIPLMNIARFSDYEGMMGYIESLRHKTVLVKGYNPAMRFKTDSYFEGAVRDLQNGLLTFSFAF